MKQKRTARTSPVHVLVISPFFAPHIGGSQKYMEELYVHLMEKHRNISVSVLSYNTDNAPVREIYRGLVVYRIPCWLIIKGQYALPQPWGLLKLLLYFSQKRIDYVHTHIRFSDAAWWAWAYAKLIGAKSIFTEHVASHPIHRSSVITGIGRLIDLTLAKVTINFYDVVTATNRPASTFLQETLHIIRRVYVSYGGVDTSYFAPPKPHRRKIIPKAGTFPRGSVIVTYAGRIIWSKGITYFHKAIREMQRLPKNVHFVFAGTGDLLQWLIEETAKYRLSARIHVTGPLTTKEMKQLLSSTDIFVHPSHHNEGFPNVLLEAGSSGCAMIATDNAGTGEILENELTATFIREKSPAAIRHALEWTLRHPKERLRMATACRKHIVSHFDWATVSKSFYRLVFEASQYTKNTET